MARTPTTIIPLGFKAPSFNLPEPLTGKTRTLEELRGDKGTVVMFICNHCPFVVHVREELIKLANDYLPRSISFIAISSNDVKNYPDDSPENMALIARSESFPFPYLYDESQDVAKAYEAACTPDFSIFDENLLCVYRGQLDDSRPGNEIPVSGKDIRHVLDCLLSGSLIPSDQKPSLGCNIKWRQ